MAEQDVETVDAGEAAALLEVGEDRIAVMVEEGMLRPLPGDGPQRFDANEVRALHNLGG